MPYSHEILLAQITVYFNVIVIGLFTVCVSVLCSHTKRTIGPLSKNPCHPFGGNTAALESTVYKHCSHFTRGGTRPWGDGLTCSRSHPEKARTCPGSDLSAVQVHIHILGMDTYLRGKGAGVPSRPLQDSH